MREAVGPGNALAYHAAYEFGGDVTELPGGQRWLDVIDQTTRLDRHLAVHDHHLIGLNAADDVAWAAGSWAAIPRTTFTGTAAELGHRLRAGADAGVTEIVYQPTGSDIAGELAAFFDAARDSVA